LSPFDYAGALEATTREKAVAPDMAVLWRGEASLLMGVGRMSDAIQSARRAAELDPLSPATTTELISALAWGGQIERAKDELQKAERLWSGTGALRDAQWAFHLRYGDPRIAMTLNPGSGAETYLRARLDPIPANVNPLVADIQRSLAQREFNEFGYAIQALGEFKKTEEAFAWLFRTPPEKVAEFSDVLFRPALDDVRRDPRFMAVAKRIGLTNYWRKSGKWPDFCSEPDLPYDCKEEAKKLGG
jgi:tetratricopeptide (TPR) repeat protein